MKLSKKIELTINRDLKESRRLLELFHQNNWIQNVQLNIFNITRSEMDDKEFNKTIARLDRLSKKLDRLHKRINILQLISYPHLEDEWKKEIGI